MSEFQTLQPNADAPRLSELVAETDGVEPPDEPDETGKCMICAHTGPIRDVDGANGVFSNSFTSSNEFSDGEGVCYRCEYLSNQKDYRRYHWLATASGGVQVIKERPELVDALLNPPEDPWMLKYKDKSDFLTVLNAWMFGQTLNTSRDQFEILVDKSRVHIDREEFAEMVEFGRRLRNRENEISKTALKGPVRAADIARYDIEREEIERINNDLSGREDWRIVVQLIQ